MKDFVGARLRQRRDRDIIEAIQNVEAGEVSELIRKGLRLALNTVKQHQPTEKPQPKILDWSHLK